MAACLLLVVDRYAVNDYVGFGLMDASKMTSLAANWSTVPKKSICSVERIGVNRWVGRTLFQ